MKRVLTMTLNPCIDRTIYFSQFRQGATNYVDNITEEAAGKGINTAIALSHIHVPVKALGFAYEEDKKSLYAKLEEEQISYAFVELPGRMRVNQKLFDKTACEMTECNERGRKVEKADVERLLTLLDTELEEASLLLLCGSVPPGVESDIYSRMIRMAKEKGVLALLDATGKLMLEGCKAIPYLIKPNREEFIAAFMDDAWMEERKSQEVLEEEITQKAEELVKRGIGYVCISLGADGMMLVDGSGVQKYPAIPVLVQSLQGAGDAMLAGFCKAIFEKEEKKMAEYALKLAASTISFPGTQMGFLE